MKKLLLINGSSRMGNCSIILKRLYESVNDKIEVETIDLRKANIKDCIGCSIECDSETGCKLIDDMKGILQKMLECDLMVIATPNYFQNVSGITKRFFDRTTPFYHKQRVLRDKRVIFVITGGLPLSVTESTVPICINGWARPMKIKWLNNYIFQAQGINQWEDKEDYESKMQNLICEVKEELEYLK